MAADFKGMLKTTATKTGAHRQSACSKSHEIQFWGKLSRIFFEQLRSGAVLLYLGVQLVYVIGHCNEEDLRGDLPAAPE